MFFRFMPVFLQVNLYSWTHLVLNRLSFPIKEDWGSRFSWLFWFFLWVFLLVILS